MKIGIISDLHSNIDSLKTVFEEFKRERIDKIICVGDVIGIGPYSKECVDFIIKNKEMFISIIRGNHENYLIRGCPKNVHNRLLSDNEREMHSWNHKQLGERQIEFIRSWNDRAELLINNVRIIVEHYPMNSEGKFKEFYKIPTLEQIHELCKEKECDVFIFGHTHEDIYYEDENKKYINPGSLGCPIKNGAANFGILEIENNTIKYKQCMKKYNVDKVIEEIRSLSYPMYEKMIDIFYRKN